MEKFYGKFNSPEELKAGYISLEKEFTKKCQELSAVKKEMEKELIKMEASVIDELALASENLDDLASEVLDGESMADEQIAESEEIIEFNSEAEEVGEKIEKVEEPITSSEVEEKNKKPYEFGLKFRNDVIKFLSKFPDAKNYMKEISKILLKDKSLLSSSEPIKYAYFMAKGKAEDSKKEDEKHSEIAAKNSSSQIEQKSYPRLLGASRAGFGGAASKKYSSFEDARADLISRYFS